MGPTPYPVEHREGQKNLLKKSHLAQFFAHDDIDRTLSICWSFRLYHGDLAYIEVHDQQSVAFTCQVFEIDTLLCRAIWVSQEWSH